MRTHLDSSTKMNLSFFIFGLSNQAHDFILLILFFSTFECRILELFLY